MDSYDNGWHKVHLYIAFVTGRGIGERGGG